MTHNDLTWKFIHEYVVENEHQLAARAAAVEMGLSTIEPEVGAQLASYAAATNATNIIEIGTGTGLSALWLLAGAPEATLTSIDPEFAHHEAAREIMTVAGYSASRIRLISGKAGDVLPRMNENSYDIVLIDGEPQQLLENMEHALRLVRIGGTILVPHALSQDVANPANRTATVTAHRTVLTEIAQAENVVSSLSSAGDGLLAMTKVSA